MAQRFEVGNTIADAGLMPILEPEYDIRASDRAQGEAFLRGCLLDRLADLRASMTDEALDAALAEAIDEIHHAAA